MSFLSRSIAAVELRLTARRLRTRPFVTAATLLTLSVGIGMATLGFTMLDAVLFSRLPFPNGERFVLVEAFTEPDGERARIEAARRDAIARHADAFEHVGAFRGADLNLLLPSGDVAPVRGAFITPASLAALPYAPVAGRLLHADDGVRGAAPAVVIRESLWKRHFSADPAIVGRRATISGVSRTIVGVMPDAFEFPSSGEVWLPLQADDNAHTFGVLREGREPAAATAQVAALSRQFEIDAPASRRLRVAVTPFVEAVSRGLEVLGSLIVSALVLVLVVIAANVSNLVLAGTLARSRELAVRTALGASRGRLIAQVFAEVFVVSAAAAAMGLAGSMAVLAWVRDTVTDMPFWVDFRASPRTMAFAAGASVLAALVAGIAPALKATRRDVAGALAASSRTSAAGFGRTATAMIAAQVALSIALLNGALVVARGVAGYMKPPLRIAASEVLTARVWAERAFDAERLLDAVSTVPGVVATGAASSLPGLSPATSMIVVQPADGSAAGPARPAPIVAVRGAFFAALGAGATAGRLFAPADFAPNAAPVAIVNEPFVRKFFGGATPIGARVRSIPEDASAPEEAWREIVGVVPDLGLSAGDANMAAGYYTPMPASGMHQLAVRTSGDARQLAGAVRLAIARVDPAIQIRDVEPLTDVGKEDRAVFAGISTGLGALGAMALVLSVMGTYAILSLAVTQRTREIGIRVALGATRLRVLRAIIGRVAVAPAIGAAAGILLGHTLVAARGIFAFRLPDSAGPWGLPALGVLMVAAGVAAAWVPARRALRVAPAEALRAE
jgi:predicted permease